MKAATARSKILSRERTITHRADFIPRLRDRIRCWTRVFIAELLCATSGEVA